MGSALFGHARSRHDRTVADFPCRKSSYLWQIGGVCRQVVVFPTCLSIAGSRLTAFRVALLGRLPGAQWTRLYSVDETIFMCGIYDYRARRVLFAVQLQDRGEHRACYVTAYETFENVVITLFYFEQGTDENYYDFFHYFVLLQHLDSLS